MKVLVLCQRGNVRSVALSYILKDRKGRKDIIASGVDILTEETFELLGHWADRIFIVGEPALIDKVPPKFMEKVYHFDIGGDVWGNPFHPELLAKLEQLLDRRTMEEK